MEKHRVSACSPPCMQQNPSFWTFFERVLSSAWFGRAWCAHEMKMGQSHVFLMPCWTYEDDEVQTVIRFTGAFFLHMLDLAGEMQSVEAADFGKVRALHAFFRHSVAVQDDNDTALAYRPDTPQHSPQDRSSLIPTIADVFPMKAGGNPLLPEYLRRLDANRDKMCIALNASEVPLALAPANAFSRPNTEDECLRSMLLVGLAARDAIALCTTGTALQLHDGSISWLCRPALPDASSARPALSRLSKSARQITQGSDGKAEYAQLDLLFLDIPHRAAPNALFGTHVERARMLVDLSIQSQVGGTGLWNFWQTPNHARAPALRNIFIQTVACFFNCGAQWLLDVAASQEHQGLSAMEPYALSVLMNHQVPLQNYLALPDGRAAVSALLSFAAELIASGIPWASGASERTHGPMIVSAPVSSSISSSASSSSSFSTTSSPSSTFPSLSLQSSSPQHAPAINPGRALIFAPFAHSKTLLLAVPAALQSAEYQPLARAWVLTTRHPYTGGVLKPAVNWTLQSKGVLFGDAAFAACLMCCGEADVRNHRVYGPLTR